MSEKNNKCQVTTCGKEEDLIDPTIFLIPTHKGEIKVKLTLCGSCHAAFSEVYVSVD